MSAQDLDPDRVEGAKPCHALDNAADQMADALLHLARRLVGEGDAQDLPGPGPSSGQDVGEPRGEDAGLAGTGARQHKKGTIGRLDGGALFRIKALEIGGLGAGQGTRRQSARPLRRRAFVKIAKINGTRGHNKGRES
jgi:hypothetical protein